MIWHFAFLFECGAIRVHLPPDQIRAELMRVVAFVVAALALAGCESDGSPSRLLGSAADGFSRGLGTGTVPAKEQQAKQTQPQRFGVFCPLKSEYVSGQNRICNYDCAGSANPVTKNSYESCGGGFMKY